VRSVRQASFHGILALLCLYKKMWLSLSNISSYTSTTTTSSNSNSENQIINGSLMTNDNNNNSKPSTNTSSSSTSDIIRPSLSPSLSFDQAVDLFQELNILATSQVHISSSFSRTNSLFFSFLSIISSHFLIFINCSFIFIHHFIYFDQFIG